MSDNGKDSKERMGYYEGSKREGKCTIGAAYGRCGLTSDHYRKADFEAGYDAGFIYFINSSQHNCGSFLRNQLEQN